MDRKNFCCRETFHSTSLKTFTKEIRYIVKNYKVISDEVKLGIRSKRTEFTKNRKLTALLKTCMRRGETGDRQKSSRRRKNYENYGNLNVVVEQVCREYSQTSEYGGREKKKSRGERIISLNFSKKS